MTSFGFHTVIPSLSNYLGPQVQKLKRIIIWGASVPLVIYILWLICVLGIVPVSGKLSFHAIQAHHGSVGGFVATMTAIVHERWVTWGINAFSNIAMTTSFLGVTLGLFDFLMDAFKRKSHYRWHRFQTALLTYVPPLIFAIYYPRGFILALGYAAIFVAILEIILPAAMAWKLRRSQQLHSPYQVKGGTPLLIILAIAGFILIAAQLVSTFKLV